MSDMDNRNDFVPAIDEIISLPPPSPQAEHKSSQIQDINLGFVVVTANVLVTAIIIVGMLVDGQQASKSIITGSIYFAITTVLYVLIYTGALSSIFAVRQREGTERLRIRAYVQIVEKTIDWRIRIEDNRALELKSQTLPQDIHRRLEQLEVAAIEDKVSAESPQTPFANARFVPPYDNRSTAAFATETQPAIDTTAQEAIAWASGLYSEGTRKPDTDKVHADGWLKVRMIGSKRGVGSKEAGLWLLHHKVIVKVPGGYRLNIQNFPRRENLRSLW